MAGGETGWTAGADAVNRRAAEAERPGAATDATGGPPCMGEVPEAGEGADGALLANNVSAPAKVRAWSGERDNPESCAKRAGRQHQLARLLSIWD